MLKRKYGGSLDSVVKYRDNIVESKIASESYIAEIKQVLKLLNCDSIQKTPLLYLVTKNPRAEGYS